MIRVKNALFSEPNVRRTAEEIESKKQNTKLRSFADTDIFDSAATTTESFVNGLLKKKEYVCLLQGEYTSYTPKVWDAADINVVEHLERTLNENKKRFPRDSHSQQCICKAYGVQGADSGSGKGHVLWLLYG